jgi:hypothetical protein
MGILSLEVAVLNEERCGNKGNRDWSKRTRIGGREL